jgi:hypothetical protein
MNLGAEKQEKYKYQLFWAIHLQSGNKYGIV